MINEENSKHLDIKKNDKNSNMRVELYHCRKHGHTEHRSAENGCVLNKDFNIVFIFLEAARKLIVYLKP